MNMITVRLPQPVRAKQPEAQEEKGDEGGGLQLPPQLIRFIVKKFMGRYLNAEEKRFGHYFELKWNELEQALQGLFWARKRRRWPLVAAAVVFGLLPCLLAVKHRRIF